MTKELNILLIEDNPADIRLIDIYLGEAFKDDYALESATQLSEALLLLGVRNYDVVLSDLTLPDSYGMNTFIKVFGACSDIPVIVLTGYGDDDFAVNAVAQGAADFLGKNNLDSNLLRRSIIYSIERNNLHKQLRKIDELEKAKELAERASKERQEFLSVMSHEIRTPLNAIVGVTNLLMEENPTKGQQEHLNILQFSAHNLLVLVNNVLDFSRIESGKIQLEKIAIQLHDLTNRVADSFRHLAQDKHLLLNVRIEKNLPEIVIGDPTRLTQVLNNLIHNALKFTEKGEVILKISSLAHKKDEIELLFEISDTGIGIEYDRLDTIFESFAQAHSSTSRMFGGTGLGLTICKQLVKMMSGDLAVESEPAKGSVFRFNVPFMIGTSDNIISKDPVKLGHPAARQDLLKGIKILVVEDNSTGRMLMDKFLVRWGAAVDSAESGEEAVEKVKLAGEDRGSNGQYDLVLMDIQMPGIDGYEANKKIRAMGFTSEQLPVIALTASVMDDDKKRVFESGMNDHIPKPVDLRELYTKIIKNVPNKAKRLDAFTSSGEFFAINQTFFEKLPKKQILNLRELLDTFEDDAFRLEYLRLYEQEFREFQGKIAAAIKENNADSLFRLVHKITPSIQRVIDNDLPGQLEHLKMLTVPENKNEIAIASLMKEIGNSCRSICDRIVAIRGEYFPNAN